VIELADHERNPSLLEVVLLLNGQPEDRCVREEDQIVCHDLGPEVETIDFRIEDPNLGVLRPLLYMFMRDLDCEETHDVCPL
jgi:hypothetical protein